MTETPSVERDPNGSETPPCKVCGSTESPDAQGQCPVRTCRAARKGNKLASVHDGRAKLTREDLATRDALMERLFTERGGRHALDIVTQLRIEDYATAQIQLGKVTQRLEALGAVSADGRKRKSLVDTYGAISARVDRLAAGLPPPRDSSAMPGLSRMPTSALELAHDLMARIVAGETLSDFERGQLAVLRAAEEGRVLLPPDPTPPAEHVVVAAQVQLPQVEPEDVREAVSTDESTGLQDAAPSCRFCNQIQVKCLALKTDRVDIWRALHSLAPEEVERRRNEATAVMMRTLGHTSPYL